MAFAPGASDVDVITPTGSTTRALPEPDKPADAAIVFGAGAGSAVDSELSLRCRAGPVSFVSFFGVEDLDVRGFDVRSAAMLMSGIGALVSSAIFVFFGALLRNCMELITAQPNKLVSICLGLDILFYRGLQCMLQRE
jgi:hypothetical protein